MCGALTAVHPVQAVCVILDVKPAKAKDEAGKQINDYWKPSVALLNEKDFLNKLKSYDKDNINPKLIDRIRTTYLTNEGFTPENAKKASPAAEGMCKWVHAMSSYEKVSCALLAMLAPPLPPPSLSYTPEARFQITLQRSVLQHCCSDTVGSTCTKLALPQSAVQKKLSVQSDWGMRMQQMCLAVQVAKVVAPKKAALHEAEASYEEVMVGLRAKQAELKV